MPKHDASAIIAALNAKAAEKGLRVVTAGELAGARREAEADVLVVSQACGIADTGCMLIVPVAGRGVFTKAAKLTLNGISGHVGPAPNERLGMVDVLFSASSKAEDKPEYTGRHLFSDMLHGREGFAWCLSLEGSEHTATTRLADMQFARFTIYDAPLDEKLAALAGGLLFAGNRVLVNGGDGMIVGDGVRGGSSPALVADLFPMRRELLLCDGEGVLAGHNVSLALPLALVADPEAMLARAAALAVRREGKVGTALAASENLLAGAVATGRHRFVDPGPGTL